MRDDEPSTARRGSECNALLGQASEAPTLVERLRTRPTGDPYLHMMAHEAADEIERLRGALRDIADVARLSSCRDLGLWDDGLAKLIAHHVEFMKA